MINSKIKILKEILGELWENSLFDSEIYEILSKIVRKNAGKNESINDFSLKDYDEEVHYCLTTVRNKNLISAPEQMKLSDTVVAFFGLSVGSHASIAWMMESRAKQIKISDPDIVSISNLNRLKLGVDSIGESKVKLTRRELLKINPHAKIFEIKTTNAMQNFLDSDPNVNIIVDAIDDMEGKITLRKYARSHNIPLISAADVGDNVILDVERYDTEPKTHFFLGRVANIDKIEFSSLSDIERKKLIIQLVGFEHNSEQMLESLLSIGTKIATWPQLGATATIAGGIIATTIKKIILGEKVISGRYFFSLDEILVKDFNSDSRKLARNDKINRIKKKLKLVNN